MTDDYSDHSDLIDVDVFRAVQIKFDRGRKHYKDGPWVGPSPLICAHDEVLDFVAYVQKASEIGEISEDISFQLIRQGVDLIQGLRLAILVRQDLENSQKKKFPGKKT